MAPARKSVQFTLLQLGAFFLIFLTSGNKHAVIFAQESEKPYLAILPNKVHRTLGRNVFIRCSAHVPNKDLVTEMKWMGPNGAEIPSHDGKIISVPGVNPNTLDLLIKLFKIEDAGLYNCTAFYAKNQLLQAEIRIEYHIDITFQDIQVKQTPIIYTDAKIKCVVNSAPPPQVDWHLNGKPIESNNPRFIIQPDGILIKNITAADEGVYRCRARIVELGQLEQRDIQVEVHVPPVITGRPEDISGKEKDSVTIQCVATGKPPPSYSWVNKDNEVLDDKEGYYVNEITGELQIMDLKSEHTGIYRCTARNQVDDVTAEAFLIVLTKPKIEEFKNITVREEDDANMKCILTGDPLPEVVFKKESEFEPFLIGVNEDDRIEVVQNKDDQGRRVGILKIAGTERRDDGLYTCKGVSDGGETEVWGHITIEFAPTFEDQTQDDFWSWEQQPVNLTCLATSIPNATIQWFLRNAPIREEDSNFKVVSPGPIGILNVTPLDESYFDTYTCRANNQQGTTEHDVTLNQVEKPGPVSSAQAKEITATTVSWLIRDPLDNGGLVVKGFEVQYKFEDSNWDESETRYWTKDSEYIVDELSPQISYVFRFAAKNDVGIGYWSGDKIIKMPKRKPPEEPLIINVEDPSQVKYIPYSNHYDLQWKVPLGNGEPIDYFEVIYYKVKNSTGKWDTAEKFRTIEVPYPEKGTTYKIEGLDTDTHYKIELRAHSEIGNSQPAEIIIKTRYGEVGCSEGSYFDLETGDCSCKDGVAGEGCDSCKSGYFLASKDPFHCEECWCNGVTNRCEPKHFMGGSMAIEFDENTHTYIFPSSDLIDVVTNYDGIIIGSDKILNFIPIYWSLPKKLTGNMVSAYGGYLKIHHSFTSHSGHLTHSRKDIIIRPKVPHQPIRAGLLIKDYDSYFDKEKRIYHFDGEFNIALKETNFKSGSPISISRREFLGVLSNIDEILIRASVNNKMISTTLKMAEIGISSYPGIEQCACPQGYDGLTCEKCRDGYSWNMSTTKCERCLCRTADSFCSYPDSSKCFCSPSTAVASCIKSSDEPSDPRVKIQVEAPPEVDRVLIISCIIAKNEDTPLLWSYVDSDEVPDSDIAFVYSNVEGRKRSLDLKIYTDKLMTDQIFKCTHGNPPHKLLASVHVMNLRKNHP